MSSAFFEAAVEDTSLSRLETWGRGTFMIARLMQERGLIRLLFSFLKVRGLSHLGYRRGKQR